MPPGMRRGVINNILLQRLRIMPIERRVAKEEGELVSKYKVWVIQTGNVGNHCASDRIRQDFLSRKGNGCV